MNTIQIDKKLEKINGFLGAFAFDQIPRSKRQSFSLVINTSSSNEPGDHWLSLVYMKNKYYFLDSYGRDLSDITFSKDFKNTIKRYVGKHKIIYNTKILQQLFSNVCGYYSIYFISQFSNGYSLKDVLDVFTDNLKYNDIYVSEFVKD